MAFSDRAARPFPDRSTSMLRGFGRWLDRASIGGGVAAAATAGVGAVVLSLGAITEPLVLAVLGAIAGGLVAWLLVPSAARRAFEAFSWLGRQELDRFERRTGGPMPTDPVAMERWLGGHPPAPATAMARVELLAFLGRLGAARAELAAIAAPDPGDHEAVVERLSQEQYVGWLAGGPIGTEPLERWIAEHSGPLVGPPEDQALLAARVTLAIAQARERFERGDPAWTAPLEAVRPALGPSARRVVIRDTFRPLVVLYAVVAGIVAMVTGLLVGLG